MSFELAMGVALNAATRSPDQSTQNGAVLANLWGAVMTSEFNRFPNGVMETSLRWERPLKYRFIEHAERGVVYRAARLGIPTKDTVMVCPWAACSDCARAIVQAGVVRLVRLPLNNGHWSGEVAIGDEILTEAGVEIVELENFTHKIRLRRNGEWWTP